MDGLLRRVYHAAKIRASHGSASPDATPEQLTPPNRKSARNAYVEVYDI